MHRPWADSNSYQASEKKDTVELNLVQGVRSQSLPFILATFLDYTSTGDFDNMSYTPAASLDNEPAANSYSCGVLTR